MKTSILALSMLLSATTFASPYYSMYVSTRTEQNQGAGTPNSCSLTLGEVDFNHAIEWRVSDIGPLWTLTHPTEGRRISSDNGTACKNTATCFVHGQRNPASFGESANASLFINNNGFKEAFQPSKAYYFAARQFIDSNENGSLDAGEFYRDWSIPLQVTNSSDYNHRCTFNTFLVK